MTEGTTVKTGKASVDYTDISVDVRVWVGGSFGELTHSFIFTPACVQYDPQDFKYRTGFGAYYIK